MTGEITKMENGTDIVRRFLQAVENRQIEKASAMLAPDVRMVFPGGAVFSRLDELVEWARSRYRFVHKTIERVDEADADDGTAVFVQGTLHGEWLDGRPFEDIRFADWFLTRNGTIVRQHVWNDISEFSGKR